MSATLEVKGLQELDAQLSELRLVASDRTAKAAVRASLEDVLASAQRLVPKDTWALHDSLAIRVLGAGKRRSLADCVATAGLAIRKVDRGKRSSKWGMRKGYVPNPRRYWHLVEFGAPANGQPAHPYVRPSFDANVSNMIARMKAELSKRIERARRRLARAA